MSDNSASRPQRGGGDGDMTVNKNPQGPVTRPGGCHSGIFYRDWYNE